MKIDGRPYNTIARILSRKDYMVEFQNLLQKMRDQGYELEKKTYIGVSHKFCQQKIIAGAVDLYEFAMGGSEKPSPQDFIFFLKEIVVCEDLDFDLITRVVRVFVDDGNYIGKSVFHGVLKSLSVGTLVESDKVLEAMEEGGYAAESSVHDLLVTGLCHAGSLDEAFKYLVNIENEGYKLDLKSWTYVVQKNSAAGKVEEALSPL